MPKEETFPVPLNIVVTRATDTNLDLLQDNALTNVGMSRVEVYQILGKVSLSLL